MHTALMECSNQHVTVVVHELVFASDTSTELYGSHLTGEMKTLAQNSAAQRARLPQCENSWKAGDGM
jgi:hypothetical protein